MARKQFLINYHTGSKETALDLSKVKLGEIVVRHNEEKPELYTKLGDDKFATFIDSVAVEAKITSATDTLNATIKGLSGATESGFAAVTKKFEDYSTTVVVNDAIADAKAEAIEAASGYAYTHIELVNTNLGGKIDSVVSELGTVSGKLQSNIDAVSGVVKANYATSADTESAIEVAKNAAIGSASGYTDGKIADVNGRIDSVVEAWGTASGKLQSDIDAVSGAVKANYATSADTESAIEAAKADVYASATTYTDAQISVVDGKIEKVAGDLKTLGEDVADLETELKNEIATKVSSAYIFKGTKATYEDLPAAETEGLEVGHVYHVVAAHNNVPAGTNWAWTGTEWDALAGEVDLSPYAKTADVEKSVEDINSTIDAVSGAANTAFEAIDNKFKLYATSVDTESAIEAAKADVYASATTYTDGEIAVVNNSIDALDLRIDTLEGLSATTQSAVQDVVINNLEGVETKRIGNVITFDFSAVTIDCGNF